MEESAINATILLKRADVVILQDKCLAFACRKVLQEVKHVPQPNLCTEACSDTIMLS